MQTIGTQIFNYLKSKPDCMMTYGHIAKKFKLTNIQAREVLSELTKIISFHIQKRGDNYCYVDMTKEIVRSAIERPFRPLVVNNPMKIRCKELYPDGFKVLTVGETYHF